MTSPVRYQDPRVILAILRSARTVAIVGLSKDPLRPSNFIGFYLQRHGYTIVPVNPRETEILGERSYPGLTAIPFPVDVVDVFRRPDAVPDIAREAVAIGAKALWLQFGVISPDGATIAEDAGARSVVDADRIALAQPVAGFDPKNHTPGHGTDDLLYQAAGTVIGEQQ